MSYVLTLASLFNNIEHCGLIPVWMTLMLNQGHRLYSFPVEQLHEATPMFMMVDYVREWTAKKLCWLKHFFFLSCWESIHCNLTDMNEINFESQCLEICR